MQANELLICSNPEGGPKNAFKLPSSVWPPDTLGGQFYTEQDEESPVSTINQFNEDFLYD
jgi:hypothetical protein